MSDNIEVKFSADTGNLNAGAGDAARSVENALRKMEGAFSRMSSAAKQGSQQTNQALTEVKEQAERSANALESLGNGFKGLISAAAIGMVAKEFVKMADQITMTDARLKLATKDSAEYAQAQKEIYRIAQQNNVGIAETTTLYTKLSPAVKELGGGAKQTGAIVDAFATSLRLSGANTQEAAAATLQFAQAMGSGKLSGDEFRSMAETSPRFMKALAESLGVPTGALKQMAADGKLTADVVGNALIKELDKLKSEAGSMPDTVSGSFQRLMNDVYNTTRTFNELFGVTKTLANMFSIVADFVKELEQVFKGTTVATDETGDAADDTGLAFKAISTVFEAVLIVGANVKFVLTQIGLALGAVAAAVAALVSGDFKAIPVIFQELAADGEKARKELDAFEARVMKMGGNVAEARRKMREAQGETGNKGEKVEANLTQPKGMPATDKDKESRLAEWRAVLTEKLEADKKYFGATTQLEIQYWEGVKARNKLTVDERRQVNSILFGLHKAAAQEERNLAQQKVDHDREMAAASLDTERAKLAMRVQMGDMSHEQELIALRELKEREYQIEMQSLEQKLNIIKEEGVARQKLYDQLATLKLQHETQMIQSDQAVLNEVQQRWQTAFEPISSAFSTAVQGVIQGTNTVGNAVRQMAGSILLSYVNMAVQMLTRWTAMQLAKLMVTKTSAAAGAAAETAAAATSATAVTTTKVAEAGAVVSANAAEAGSGAAASQASIPYVGPALAAAAFAATIGLVLGAKKLFSASKGFDVPAGTSPLTQLHEKEMVLPASLADNVRNMTGSSGNQPINVTISAVDSRSVRDLFMREGNALSDAIRKQSRSFGLTGRDLRGAAAR